MSEWPNSVSIGGFVADLDATDGFRITGKLTGWDDAPPVRATIDDRAQADGGWDASGYYSSRLVTLEGAVAMDTHAAAQAVKDDLLSLSPRSVHELVVDNEAIGPRSALVRVTVGAVLEWLNGEAFTYSLQLTAPDPLKYGPQTFGSTTLAAAAGGAGRVWPRAWPRDWGVPPGVTPGSVVVPNAGTASYHPRLRIDGYVRNPVVQLVETGAWVRFGGEVLDGQWLDFDLGRRRVLVNGQVSQRHRVAFGGDWLAVPVGGGQVTWSADSYNDNHKLSAWGYEGAWL